MTSGSVVATAAAGGIGTPSSAAAVAAIVAVAVGSWLAAAWGWSAASVSQPAFVAKDVMKKPSRAVRANDRGRAILRGSMVYLRYYCFLKT
jgi:hypothetical protein